MQIVAEIEDSTHLKLAQPLEMVAGTRIVIDIVDTERDDFMAGASALLERAFGDDEPDYSEAGVALTDDR